MMVSKFKNTENIHTLTYNVIDQVMELINYGCNFYAACEMAKLDIVLVDRWLDRGKREEERVRGRKKKIKLKEQIYYDFYKASRSVKGQSECREIIQLQGFAKDNYIPLIWHLQHAYPEHWGKQNKTQITGANDGPIEIVEGSKDELISKLLTFATDYEEEDD